MAAVGEGFILQHIHNNSFQSGDRLVEFGDYVFVTTGTSVAVPTLLSALDCALLTPRHATAGVSVANGQLTSDTAVETNTINVWRVAGTDSALSFYYMFIGRRFD